MSGSAGTAGSGGMPECQSPEDCNDGNECTENACIDATCSNLPVEDGAACGNGAATCQAGSCVGVFACTEQGIRAAIAAGGGPHTFDCDGPTTVVTVAEIVIYNDVILDGEENLTVDGADDHRVLLVAGTTVELRGVTVTHGAGDGRANPGGGIYNGGTLTLTNSAVSGNAAADGAGISNGYQATLTLTNSTVSGNTADDDGGGIYNTGTLTLTNSTVSGNTASSGGGIYNIGTLTLTNSTVSGNTASSGGGIYNSGDGFYFEGKVVLSHSTVSNNAASAGGGVYNRFLATLSLTNSAVSGNSAGWGGGISNGGTLALTNCTLSGNSADYYGGGIYNEGTLTLTNCTLSGNSAGYYGGGIYNWYGATLTLTNSTLSGNSAGSGGSVYNDGTLALTNSTLSGNTADYNGGGIYNERHTDADQQHAVEQYRGPRWRWHLPVHRLPDAEQQPGGRRL